jgi:hypothetical protein
MQAEGTAVGRKFGRLVASGKNRRLNGYIQWECSCFCGKKKWISKDSLLNGYTKSCGCLQREQASAASLIDIAGEKYGRLIVTEKTEHRRGCVYWLCRCNCGKEKWVDGKHLRHGGTRSCGCLELESRGKAQRLKLAGRMFGRLTASSQFEPRRGQIYWRCLCKCGREVWIPSSQLTCGNTQSCGCLKREMNAAAAAARKQFAVVLTGEERQLMETEINQLSEASPKRTALAALLLADHSDSGQKLSDTEIAKKLGITHARAFYIRQQFMNPAFRLKQNAKSKEMWNTSVNYRLAKLLGHRIRLSMKSQGLRKDLRASELLGCSIEFFKSHLEQRFQPGMSWENYGAHGWHLDHIRPCASFNLKNKADLKQCFHYGNYQPLWSSKNVSKSSQWAGKFWRHKEHGR